MTKSKEKEDHPQPSQLTQYQHQLRQPMADRTFFVASTPGGAPSARGRQQARAGAGTQHHRRENLHAVLGCYTPGGLPATHTHSTTRALITKEGGAEQNQGLSSMICSQVG